MLIRNIDQIVGLCNGTLLEILCISERLKEVKVISGTNIGSTTSPRLQLTSADK